MSLSLTNDKLVEIRCFSLSTMSSPKSDKLKHIGHSEIRYFECGDRDTEIRAIAKEIKRLTLVEHYQLSDIALVVRQRDAYAKTIASDA